jgi:hypothetical protein
MTHNNTSPLKGTLPDLLPHRFEKRKVFILRLWEHRCDGPVWIGEIYDIATSETVHTPNLEALFDWLRKKTSQVLESSANKEKRVNNSKEISSHAVPCTYAETNEATDVVNPYGPSSSAQTTKE